MPDDIQTILGFDYGEKRIGVAVGNTQVPVATPLTAFVVTSASQKFLTIQELIQEWQPSILVVGLPCHPDGAPHKMTERAMRFARQLSGRFHLPVELVDERYTSAIAATNLRDLPASAKKRKKETVDCVAAQLILQSYLDELTYEFRFPSNAT